MKSTDLLKASKQFWIANSIGWLSVYIVNVFFQTKFFSVNSDAYLYSAIICVVAFVLSFFLRFLILKFRVAQRKFVFSVLISVILMVVFSFILVLIYLPILDMIYNKDVMSITSVLGEWVDLAPLFFIWTLIYVTYIIFIEQQKLIKEKYEITLELKESELSNLRNQLSPHFLFNSINNLRSLILVDPEKARSGLLEMSDLLRYVLNYQKHRTVALEEELEVVNSYLELNKIHLGDNVNFEVDFDSSLLNFQIPPMSIQLLVENAIKHGEIKDNASVSIKAIKNETHILFEITNPGNLGKDSEYGIGLKNLRARLKSVFGERVMFTIQEKNQLVIAEILIQND